MFLLDTNTCIQILNGTSPAVAERLSQHNPVELFLCSIVKAELLYGARHSQRVTEKLALLDRFFAPFISLPFDDRCAGQYGQIRAELAQQGCLIGPNDLLISAIARTHDLTIVTHNYQEFARVPNLRVEDWFTEGS